MSLRQAEAKLGINKTEQRQAGRVEGEPQHKENSKKSTPLVLTFRKNIWLVVEPTHLKNMLVKLEFFPQIWGENLKKSEATT